MKKTKKFLALVMAAAMALAPTAVYADNTATGGAIGNTGTFEGWITKEVFDYTLPTQGANSFDFIVDPQNLIADSGDVNNTGAVTEGALGVYIKQADGDWAVSSDALVVENKSSMQLDVSIEASITITSADAVQLVTEGAVTKSIADESSDMNLCIAVKEMTSGAVEYIDNTSKKATLDTTMAALDADNFEITTDGSGGYKYQAKDDSTDKEVTKFYLTGSCNTKADWSAAEDMTTSLDVLWTVEGVSDDVTLTATSTLPEPGFDNWEGENDAVIWFDLGMTADIDLVTISADNGKQVKVTDYDTSDETWFSLDFNDDSLSSYLSAQTVTVYIQIDSNVLSCKLW